MDPFGADAALHRPTSRGYISSAHRTGKEGAGVRMNAAAYKEKEKNEKTARERKQLTNFRGCVLPFRGRSGDSTAKKWFARVKHPG